MAWTTWCRSWPVAIPCPDSTGRGASPAAALVDELAGWAIVLIGVVEVIIDVRFGAYEDFASIGALATYAGYAMGFVGARQITTRIQRSLASWSDGV